MTPGHELSDLDGRILAVLGGYDPARIWPSLRTIAARVQASPRHVRRRLAVLEELGCVERLAVHERPDDAEWTRRGQSSRGPGRQTSNSYRLAGGRPPGHGTQPDVDDVRGPPDMGYPQTAAQPPGHAKTMSALERVSEASTVRPEGDRGSWAKAKAGLDRKLGRDTGVLSPERWREDGSPDVLSVYDLGAGHLGFEVDRQRENDPLDVGRQRDPSGFDHPPSKGEVLAALQGGLGTVEILAEWPNETGPTPGTDLIYIGWNWAEHWQPEPVGRCSRVGTDGSRCEPGRKVRWPHTLGPDRKPWHAYCWMEPTTPLPKRRWMRGGA